MTTRASKETQPSLGDLDHRLNLVLPSSSSSSLPPLLALKEWAPVVDSLATGRVTLLLRKGGVREPRFVPKARSFALVPTSHHTDAGALRKDLFSDDENGDGDEESFKASFAFDQRDPGGIEIRVAACVTGAWTVSGDENIGAALEALARFHPYRSSPPPSSTSATSTSTSSTLARLGYRPGSPLTLLELRAFSSPAVRVPAEIAEAYWGCRSWVELAEAEAEEIRKNSMSPALGEGEFLAKARALRETLSLIQGVESLELPLYKN